MRPKTTSSPLEQSFYGASFRPHLDTGGFDDFKSRTLTPLVVLAIDVDAATDDSISCIFKALPPLTTRLLVRITIIIEWFLQALIPGLSYSRKNAILSPRAAGS